MEIHALRPIGPGEELTTDYATFESEIRHMPGACLCGSPGCRGKVTGYRGLPEARRAAFGPYIADYLREIDPVPAAASLDHPMSAPVEESSRWPIPQLS